MERKVLLATVTKVNDTKPFAYGIYERTSAMTDSMSRLGLVTEPVQLKNKDGSLASLLFINDRYMVSVVAMPISMAMQISTEGRECKVTPS